MNDGDSTLLSVGIYLVEVTASKGFSAFGGRSFRDLERICESSALRMPIFIWYGQVRWHDCNIIDSNISLQRMKRNDRKWVRFPNTGASESADLSFEIMYKECTEVS